MNASRYYNDGERRLSGLRSAPSTKSSVESEPEWLLYEYEHPAYKNRVQAYSNVNIRGLLAGVTYPMKVRQIEGLATAYEAQRLAQQMANPNMTEQDLYNIVGALIRRDYCCVMVCTEAEFSARLMNVERGAAEILTGQKASRRSDSALSDLSRNKTPRASFSASSSSLVRDRTNLCREHLCHDLVSTEAMRALRMLPQRKCLQRIL